jgi:hypothetical protein
MPNPAESASWRTMARSHAIAGDALSTKDVADALGVSEGRIRQRLHDRSLVGIQEQRTWRVPRFQFTQTGRVLPGLPELLRVVPEDVPLVVLATFLDRVSPDLVPGDDPVTPRVWLESGGDVANVVELAGSLLTLP